MAMNFELADTEQVFRIWHESPHASVFTSPGVLEALAKRVDWWFAFKGEEPFCLWPACINNNEMYLPEFTYYVGPVWSKEAYAMPAHRWLADTTEVYEGFINIFLKNYGTIKASLAIGLEDVRVFDWWNFHEPNKPRFTIKPRYTGIIDDLQKKSERDIISNFRRNRRRELRYFETQLSVEITDHWKVVDIVRLYKNTMARQNIIISSDIEYQIIKLVELVKMNFGDIIAVKEKDSDKVIAAYLMLYGNNVANAVLSMVDDDWRAKGLSSWLVFNSIRIARDRGLCMYDFNGTNSPNRGDDKHSYGAAPVLFFEIDYPGHIN